jgi:rod shape-determining protein MreC
LAKDRNQDTDYAIQIRRLLVGVVVLCLVAIFLIWRVDSPRIERFRAQVIDTVVPSFDWAMAPVTGMVNILRDFQSYQRIYEQNQELRRELQKMKSWREAALQLEQENARLLDLNNVQLDPRLTFVTGVVLADSGSPFRQSVLINVGSRDGIVDGWAAMDGLGLVGRISGVGDNTARVILLTDTSSRIPVTIQPSGQHAIVAGDNTAAPLISFVEEPDEVRPGDRVMTSGDGGVFPAGLLVGELARDPGGRLRVRLSADYERLEFLRVLRNWQETQISETGQIVRPDTEPDADPGAEPVGDTGPDADTPEANPLAAPLEPVGEAADG